MASSILSLSLAARRAERSADCERCRFRLEASAGTSLSVSFTQHPYADAIIQRLPQFKELTGIDVKYELTPEENYFDKMTTQLSAGTGVPDVFMTGVYQMWVLRERQTP